MLRRMITLLALFTGLAATGAPAQAIVYGATAGVELAEGVEKPSKGESCDSLRTERCVAGIPLAAMPRIPAHGAAVPVPTVQVGIDRAAE